MSSLIDEYSDKETFIEAYEEKQDKRKRVLQEKMKKMKEMKEKFMQYYKRNILHVEDTTEHDQKVCQTLYEECLAYLDELTKRNEALEKLNEELAKKK